MSNSHFQPPNVSTAASVMGDIVGDWFKLWNSKLQVLRKTQKCLLKIQYLPEHIHFSTWGGIQLLPMSKLKTKRHTSTTHVKVKDSEIYTPTTHVKTNDRPAAVLGIGGHGVTDYSPSWARQDGVRACEPVDNLSSHFMGAPLFVPPTSFLPPLFFWDTSWASSQNGWESTNLLAFYVDIQRKCVGQLLLFLHAVLDHCVR